MAKLFEYIALTIIIVYYIYSVITTCLEKEKLKKENAKLKKIIEKDINIFEGISKSNLRFEKDFHDYMESLRNDAKENLPQWAQDLTTKNVEEMRDIK